MTTNESKEDYLERILMLQERNNKVKAIDIVNDMGYSKPSVSIALKKLKNENLIEIDVNNYISLTDEGKEIAKRIYERHQILSNLLIKIGVSEDVALEDACKIEHDLSIESFNKIKDYYNNLK